jgi:hypothetical protein
MLIIVVYVKPATTQIDLQTYLVFLDKGRHCRKKSKTCLVQKLPRGSRERPYEFAEVASSKLTTSPNTKHLRRLPSWV